MKNILEYLEKAAIQNPNKICFSSAEEKITFLDLKNKAMKIGSSLLKYKNEPIALYFDKNINLICCMLGVIYSGNFYTVIDPNMPLERVNAIFNTLKPRVIITEDKYANKVNSLNVDEKINYNSIDGINIDGLSRVRERMIDTDLVYAIYTSGSTGAPKGTVVNHITLIKYIEWFTKEMNITSDTVIGGQTPFYFSASVSDFYATIVCQATYYIIPKMYFMFPIKLIDFLNENKINTIYWVPSALSILSNLKVFDYKKPLYLNKVLFIGEVMPVKQLNYYMDNLEDITYVNLYGPTETVDVCTFYKITRRFNNDEVYPIGKHCDNCDVFILKDDNTLAEKGEEGELCVRGSFLAQGYYNMPEKTNSAFCQNPLNNSYPERIYRTGDIVKENENGDIVFVCRKDFQIKHMGYRIELGEIENAASSIEEVKTCLAIYDVEDKAIILIYEGKCKEEAIRQKCVEKLPSYMLPAKIIKVKQIVYNANGKIDRVYYKKNYKEL